MAGNQPVSLADHGFTTARCRGRPRPGLWIHALGERGV